MLMYIDAIQNLQILKVENLMSKTYQKENGMVSPYPENWSEQNQITPTRQSEKEAKILTEVMYIATMKSEETDQLLKKFEYRKVIRIKCFI